MLRKSFINPAPATKKTGNMVAGLATKKPWILKLEVYPGEEIKKQMN